MDGRAAMTDALQGRLGNGASRAETIEPFHDNWAYIHDPGTRAGRVQNFVALSEARVPPGRNCLGVEYLCFQGDEIWNLSSAEAVELAREELARIGLQLPDVQAQRPAPLQQPGSQR